MEKFINEFSEDKQGEIMKRIQTVRALKGETIAFLTGRPKRYKPIQKEDLVNLKIALNTAKSFDEFLFLI